MIRGVSLVLLALLFVGTAAALSPVAGEEEPQTSRTAQPRSADPSPEGDAPLGVHQCASPKEAPGNPEEGGTWKDSVWPPSWSNWAIFLVTAAYTIFAGLQWQAIRDQGRASLDTTRALERPWIVPVINQSEVTNAIVAALSDKAGGPPWPIDVRLSVRNDGRSTAIVFAMSASVDLLPMKLPDTPPREEFGEFPPVPLAQAQQAFNLSEPGSLDLAAAQEIVAGKSQLVFYCAIKYRDVFGPDGRGSEHVSRMAWGWWSVPQSEKERLAGMASLKSGPVGDAKWNQYT